MAQTINTNISSLTAQRSATKVQDQLATSMARLSSGLRINSAKDDAAGLAISERFTTQIRGLNQAARNANDAISLAQTAEGALGSIGDNLQRIRELAVQSANATNSASDRAALQAEAAQLIAEVQRVGTQTEFNGIKLLDGSFTAKAFQVGANAGETISIDSIVDARSTRLGTNSLLTNGTKMGSITTGSATDNAIAAETNLTLTVGSGSSAVTTSPISYALNASAKDIADAINGAGANVGINAVATNSATLSALSTDGTVAFTLNGQAISVAVTDKDDLSAVVSAINGVAGTTGVTATFTTTGAKGSITLTSADGSNIGIGGFAVTGGASGATDSVSFNGSILTEGGTIAAVKTGSIAISSTRGEFSVGGSAADVFGAVNSSFASLQAVDLSTATGASDALAVIDAALEQANGGRASLGAAQNRFLSTIASLQTTSENLSASRSRIQDADFAAETAALSRAQVLQQAATAMVAQANQLPQQVLQLLKG